MFVGDSVPAPRTNDPFGRVSIADHFADAVILQDFRVLGRDRRRIMPTTGAAYYVDDEMIVALRLRALIATRRGRGPRMDVAVVRPPTIACTDRGSAAMAR